jgi:hypothetical protein
VNPKARPVLRRPAGGIANLPEDRPLPPAPPGWQNPADDQSIERLFRRLALPVALGAAFLLVHSPLRMLGRTLLSMWVHEIGHAVTAWLCGFFAFPGAWKTVISDDRVVVVSLTLAAALAYPLVLAWRARRPWWAAGLAALLLAQAVMTLGIRPGAARQLILFGGDAGSLVLGTALMLTFYVARGTHLHVSWLRWGFLVIGAVAFADAFAEWWEYGHSLEGVVFGENVGSSGPSDPTRLAMEYGWSEHRLIARHMAVGWTCFLVLAAAYVAGWRAPAADDQASSSSSG